MFENRFLFLRVVLVFLSIFCFVFVFALSADTKSTLTTHLSILYDNDLHGQLIPFDDAKNGINVGGAARRAFLINKFKSENPNTLVFDAGDDVHGTCLISDLFQGEVDYGTLVRMPYDALILGNHDFDYNRAIQRHFIETSPIPVLSANIFEKDNSLLANTKPYIIKNIAGLKIAIIGLTTNTRVDGLHFGDPVEVLGGYMPELKKQADLIIAVTHLGIQVDRNLAKKVNGIDVIVGGHSHTKIDSYERSGNTLIVQDYYCGIYLGKLDLTIVDKKIVDQQAKLIPINNSIPDDPVIAAYLKPYVDTVNVVVGKTEMDLNESYLKNWFCNAFREQLNTDIALLNTFGNNWGGARHSLDKGNITYEYLFEIFNHDNNMVVLEAKGDLVQQILDMSEGTSASGPTFNLVSGKAENIQIGGKPLDLSKIYTITAADYMIHGISNVSELLKQAKLVRTDKLQRDIIANYLMNHPVISALPK